jgi:hypothetical protein
MLRIAGVSPIKRYTNAGLFNCFKVLFSSDIAKEIQIANSKSSGDWILKKTTDKGWGIFATKSISAPKLLFQARGLHKMEARNSHSVQTDWTMHVHMDLPARFINHSCDANVGIVDNDIGAFDYIAIKDVSYGEELTWDYGSTEFASISIEQCLCGSPKCRGSQIAFSASHKVIRQQYGQYYGKYLHNWEPSFIEGT